MVAMTLHVRSYYIGKCSYRYVTPAVLLMAVGKVKGGCRSGREDKQISEKDKGVSLFG